MMQDVSSTTVDDNGRLFDPNLIGGLIVVVLLGMTPLLAEVFGGDYLISLAMKAMVFAIAAISLNILISDGGLVSFGHAAFLGLGSYVTGIALTEGITNLAAIVLLVIVFCGLFALITGAISLRTSGVHFIMITLAFGQMLFFILSSLSSYGGDDGLTLWDTPQIMGLNLLESGSGLFQSTLFILFVVWIFSDRLSRSRFGRVLRAGKHSELRVKSMGFDIYRFRLAAYVIAGVLTGIAGMVFATSAEFISPSTATWQNSGTLIIMVVLGGMGSRNGALYGAVFVVLIEEALSLITLDWKLLFGLLLIAVVLFTDGGIASLLSKLLSKLKGSK
jgi:branched-chain amino acid transport system permease protein